jgi:hypothetical protein
MASIKTRQQLPDLAKPTADLIEKFGFQWELDFEYPTPDAAKRVQIREEKHYVPRAMVMQIAAAMARQEKFAPVVVTADGYLIDGNTRTAAARHNRQPFIQALIIQDKYEGATDKVTRRLRLLGAAFNARHGKGIDREEIRKAVEVIGEDPTYDGTRIAALIGVTDATVKSMLAEMRARQRAESVGIHLNGSVTATPLRVLGQASEKINDEPFAAVASLAQDTGMSGGELRDVIRQMHDAKSDEGALAVVDEHRKARREQIAEYRASGKSKPPPAAKLRQRLGFILEFEKNPRDLAELNPEVVAKHREQIQRSIAILQAVLDMNGAGGRDR